jgi:hypothetical protein
VLCTSTSSSTTTRYLVNIICPIPEAVHDFVGPHPLGLPDAHEDEVTEDALRRQRDVHDLGEVHLEMGKKSFTDAPPM